MLCEPIIFELMVQKILRQMTMLHERVELGVPYEHLASDELVLDAYCEMALLLTGNDNYYFERIENNQILVLHQEHEILDDNVTIHIEDCEIKRWSIYK